jgi:hypothetical protein
MQTTMIFLYEHTWRIITWVFNLILKYFLIHCICGPNTPHHITKHINLDGMDITKNIFGPRLELSLTSMKLSPNTLKEIGESNYALTFFSFHF